jgi:predicted TIM-barrel fold metal-dependent hydrolase
VIIDVHAHYGHDYVFDEDNYSEVLLYWCDRCGIDHAIVQPSVPRPYLEDTSAIHNEIFELCNQRRGRFFGMASINPHFKPGDYDKELTRCIKELGFVGVKITPVGHAAHPALQSCMHAYESCAGLNIPVMIHMDGNGCFSHPFNILEPAKAFPHVKFVMAHAGGNAYFAAALYAAQQCSNVYLETSWLDIYSLKNALEALGPERIMFSSDMPMNIPVELAKYRALTKDTEVLAQLFSKTAMDVYNLNIK